MQAGKSQRSVLALVITCALILGFGIPLIPLVGVDSAEGTEVSAASDVATVSAENSLQNGSFEQPDVYQYRETSDVPYWKSTTTSGNIEIGSVFKNGNGDNDSLHMRTGEKVAAAEGSQFGKPATSNGNDQYAELNSNQASSLYQVVNTVPESKYDWGLYHRGRQGKDAMALVVGPKQNVAPMKRPPPATTSCSRSSHGCRASRTVISALTWCISARPAPAGKSPYTPPNSRPAADSTPPA